MRTSSGRAMGRPRQADDKGGARGRAAYLEAVLQASREAILVVDSGCRVVWLNHALEELLALPPGEWEGKPLKAVLRLLDEESRETQVLNAEALGDPARLTELAQHALVVRHDGREFPFELRCEPVPEPAGWILFLRDAYQIRLLSETVSFQRSHDTLTGLLNRAEFERVLQAAVDDAHKNQRWHAVCFLDLDQFKVINNTCGHFAGDELLRQITELLRLDLMEGDTVARLGSDEFGILFWNVEREEALQRAEQLARLIHEELFVWGNKVFSLACCIGLVGIDAGCDSWAAVLRQAEIACNHAKQTGGNRVAVFSEDDRELVRQTTEMEWVSTIVQALQTDRFVLFGQPIVPLAQWAGAPHLEILVRMRSPEGDLIPPGAFLPSAERYNLSLMLDRWVFSHTLEWLIERHHAGDDLGLCAINLSGASLCQPAFLDFLMGEIRQSGIASEQLCFEITETAAVSNLSIAKNFISALKDCGCRFALDDFGAGMSSFAYLKNLPVDYLKIDGLFVRDIVRERIDYAMVKSINDIGHVMSMKTIAEFVEDDATLRALRTIGVDYAQGFGIAKPMPLSEYLEFVKRPLRERELASNTRTDPEGRRR